MQQLIEKSRKVSTSLKGAVVSSVLSEDGYSYEALKQPISGHESCEQYASRVFRSHILSNSIGVSLRRFRNLFRSPG